MTATQGENMPNPSGLLKRLAPAFALILLAGLVLAYLVFVPAHSFPAGKIFKIEKGESLTDIASDLRIKRFIRSRSLFKLAVILNGGSTNLKSGDYFFREPISLLEIARRIENGISGIENVRVTIPEGYNLWQIASLFENLGMFDSKEFFNETGTPAADLKKDLKANRPRDFSKASLLITKKPGNVSLEGYLFPDTYFFQINDPPGTILERMIQNFDKKITPRIREDVISQGKTMHQILTMASLLEEEATSTADRQTISGILWRRLKIGMALQVDPTVRYAVGKISGPIPAEDYKFDSTFNTYKYRGLPPGPISSPGIKAIEAAVNPTMSPYLYYLSDSEGMIHYAKTFEEHKLNKEKYLR